MKSDKETKKRGIIYEWGIPIAIAVVLALLINKFLLFKAYIPSRSMVPTLNVDDQLFVSKVYNPEKLERGDVVVFYSDELGERLIKRLIGLPGDIISIQDGVVTINGEVIQEDYVKHNDNTNGNYRVPQGKYFFLGDNRADSADSRAWDNPYIEADKIEGKAQLKIYPFSDIGTIK